MRRHKRKLTVLSAFTGLGGLDLGLEAAGFKTIACIERDPTTRLSIHANRPNRKLLKTADIVDVARILSPKDLGLRRRQLNVLAGGPPCQPFSKAAQWAETGRRGLADPRAKCLSAFLRLAERFLPRVVLIENVPGFARGETSAIRAIKAKLRRINKRYRTSYRLEWRVLNAADYGVPQKRDRTILIARRDGRAFDWPASTHAGRHVRAYDALADVTAIKRPKLTGYWAELLGSIPEGRNYLYLTKEGGGPPVFGSRRRYWSFLLKLAKDSPAWTISAQPGPATGPFHWSNRPLAIKELLRLQSFPKGWRVSGSRTAQVRQIGNATPPLLAEVIGRALGNSVFGRTYQNPLRLGISRRRKVPAATAPASIPAKYRKHVGRHTAHPGEGRGPGAKARAKKEAPRDRQRTARRTKPVAPKRRLALTARVASGAVVERAVRRSGVQSGRRRRGLRTPRRVQPATRAA
ncbi:MAG: DNA cytosine methyltransferase [Gammaproteobacteria bacterium]